jgi:hypothetical protein
MEIVRGKQCVVNGGRGIRFRLLSDKDLIKTFHAKRRERVDESSLRNLLPHIRNCRRHAGSTQPPDDITVV